MKALIDYIQNHTIRGTCTCDQCDDADHAQHPQITNPNAHAIDLVFFKVAINPEKPPVARTLRQLIVDHTKRSRTGLDLFDGNKHDYFEIGDWIGDQGIALQLMGLGALLKLWRLNTPASLAPAGKTFPRATALSLAQAGCIEIMST